MKSKIQMTERIKANHPRVDIKEVRPKIADLASKHKLLMEVLFGSQVTDRIHPNSDIDIAVMPDRQWNLNVDELCGELTAVFGTNNVDLAVLTHAHPLLWWQVARDGILVYSRNERDWPLFKTRAMKSYSDFARFEKYWVKHVDEALKRWKVR